MSLLVGAELRRRQEEIGRLRADVERLQVDLSAFEAASRNDLNAVAAACRELQADRDLARAERDRILSVMADLRTWLEKKTGRTVRMRGPSAYDNVLEKLDSLRAWAGLKS